MEIKADDLLGGEVLELLEEHMAGMLATSPPDSVHALDHRSLKSPEIAFYSGWDGEKLLGCVAIKKLTIDHGEIKSMRTATAARNTGVATKLLNHVFGIALDRGYKKISLETGSQEFFKPARKLYEKNGFIVAGDLYQDLLGQKRRGVQE